MPVCPAGGWPRTASQAPRRARYPGGVTFPVVGMVGGGQLARMTHEAGIPLGLKFKLLSDTPQDSAAQVVSEVVIGDYRDLETLRAFARGCDVITFDHEHVPTEHLRALEADGIPVRPGPDALVHAQDKGVMRAKLAEIGAPCPRNRIVSDPADVAAFAEEAGASPSSSRPCAAGTTARACGWSAPRRTRPTRSEPGSRSSRRRRSTSYGSWRPTSSARRTARPSPTRSWSPSRSTVSATR